MLFPPDAHAYLDPGTTSMVLQTLAAGAIALAVFWSRFKAKIRAVLSAKNASKIDADRAEHEKHEEGKP
jgi:hypothetical protein